MSTDFIRLEPLPENAQVIERLNTLADGLQDKALYRAVRASATPISNLMKATAPDDPSTPGSALALAVNISRLKAGQPVRVGQGTHSKADIGDGEVAAVVGPNRRSMTISGQRFDLRFLQTVALWVEHGTRPHQVGKKKARLSIRGVMVTGPIRHPGTRPRHWMQRSLEAASGQMQTEFYRSLADFMERHDGR